VGVTTQASKLDPYVPRLVAAWGRNDPVHRGIDGSLVSVDIAGFTALSERLGAKGKAGAEELIARISATYGELILLSHARGGDVLKFRGDALLLFFQGDGHSARATAAAYDMNAYMESLAGSDVVLRMACAVWSGVCDFFLVGSSHRELVVAGPAATAVLRLEDEAEAGEILLSAGAADALDLEPGRLQSRVDAPPPPQLDVASRDLPELVPGPLRHLLETGAAEAEHRLATVAFVKFSGTDSLVQDDPDLAAARIAELGRIVGEAADAYDITWLESDIDVNGGKLYLVAGAPTSRGDEEERMLLALRRVIDAEPELTVRAGVNRGHIFAGLIGGGPRRTYAVMGDVVNVAARLVGRADPGALLVTEDVLNKSRTRFETSGQPFLMKGKAQPVTAFAVGAATAALAAQVQEKLPLVGRETELAVLESALDDARSRRTRAIELIGEPGIGKSRLVEELESAAVGFQVLRARGEEYVGGEPYSAFRPLLRPLAGIRDEDDEDAAAGRLQGFASAVIPDLAPWLPLLAIPFGVSVPETQEAADLEASFRREKLLETVDTFLTRMLMMPTLLIVEDTHLLDDGSRELLRKTIQGLPFRPWLILTTRRADGPSVGGEQMELAALPDHAAHALVMAAAGAVALSEDDLARLTERCGGNPLFARELVASRLEGTTGDLPETVETVLTARIDNLAPTDRLLIRCAAVIGGAFEADLLEEVLAGEDVSAADVARLSELTDFVVEDEPGQFRFAHELLGAAAYEGLSFARRRELHRKIGLAIEARSGDEAASVLSRHFYAAEEFDRAWRFGVIAGDAARAGYANVDAAEYYGRAIDAARELTTVAPEEVARVAENLGDVREVAAQYGDAQAAYWLARDLLTDRPLDQARLLSKTGYLLEKDARYAEAIAEHEKGLTLLRESGVSDDALAARLQIAIAGALYRQAKFEECEAACHVAVGHAEAGGARDELAHAYYLLDVATTQLGRPNPLYRERALPIYEEIGDLVGQAKVLNNLGIAAYYEGRWDEAVDLYRRSDGASSRAGDVMSAATVRMNEAEILSDQGHLEEARRLFEEALRSFRAAQFRVAVALCTSDLGREAAREGRFDDAHQLLEQALADSEEYGANEFALDARARLAECLVFEGRHREAFAGATDVLERAGEGDATRPLRAMAERLLGLAEAQDRAKDRALPHLRRSVELARAAGADFELAMTLRALAELGHTEGEAEAHEILERLGVVRLPRVPLP
jgi:class 3 adenylate cyclase/tetratricopeptide (TPR) repeat protein